MLLLLIINVMLLLHLCTSALFLHVLTCVLEYPTYYLLFIALFHHIQTCSLLLSADLTYLLSCGHWPPFYICSLYKSTQRLCEWTRRFVLLQDPGRNCGLEHSVAMHAHKLAGNSPPFLHLVCAALLPS
jgi:hypothetical protein